MCVMDTQEGSTVLMFKSNPKFTIGSVDTLPKKGKIFPFLFPDFTVKSEQFISELKLCLCFQDSLFTFSAIQCFVETVISDMVGIRV